ncbi:MAG: hypothetical protein Q8P62_03135 [Candidatus Peregrinibacteria bacterium]|nr:hypothetical protein [Candidatus Peregrinibacteria bacterium]
MKKILIIPISILLLTACARVETPSTQQEGSTSTQEIQKEIPLSVNQQQLQDARGEQTECDKKDERKCTIEIAKKMEVIETKNEFLRNYLYLLETPTKEDSVVCDEITKGSKDQASCYWTLAMELKDTSICNKIMPYTAEKESMAANAENCKNTISYKYGKTEWELATGTPLYGDYGFSYAGKATLKGWMEFDEYYNEENQQLFFHISPEDKIKLPPAMQSTKREQFILVDESREQMSKDSESKMTKYTEKNPLTIDVTELYTPSEGAAELTVEKFPQ